MSYAQIIEQVHDCAVQHQVLVPQVVAVSKGQTAEDITRLIELGATHFAENRLSEIEQKWPTLRQRYPYVVLHYIGALQSNKVKKILSYCQVLHTIDTLSAAQQLAVCQKEGLDMPQLYVQVNAFDEAHKRGIAPAQLPTMLEYLQHQQIAVEGLMILPPPHQSVQGFTMLHQLAQRYKLHGLSMGMSDDFIQAIAHGSTCLRLGRILFDKKEQ